MATDRSRKAPRRAAQAPPLHGGPGHTAGERVLAPAGVETHHLHYYGTFVVPAAAALQSAAAPADAGNGRGCGAAGFKPGPPQ